MWYVLGRMNWVSWKRLQKVKRTVSDNVEGYNVHTLKCEITVVCVVKVLLEVVLEAVELPVYVVWIVVWNFVNVLKEYNRYGVNF